MRAVIENNLIAQEGSRQKLFYIGPNFRYERPQKGRLRQHHQFGVEAFGIAEPEQDVECILLQMDFYRRCGVKDFELNDQQPRRQGKQAAISRCAGEISHAQSGATQRGEPAPLG